MSRIDKKKEKKHPIKKAMKIIFFIGLITLIGACAFGYFYTADARQMVLDSTEESFVENNVSYVYYDDDKTLAAKLSNEPIKNMIYLKYDKIPDNVINAFIAVEDRSFWSNCGVDLKGILRVGIDYIISMGEEAHGASTITQQLARNVFLSQEVTIDRKIKEIYVALELNRKYTKKQIMEFYINNIYFANGCYGIEAASNYYFDKQSKDLTLAEITYLCSIPNSPTYYDPIENPQNALERKDKILTDMFELDYINEEQYNDAKEEIINLNLSGTSTGGNNLYHNYETTYAVKCAAEALMKQDGFNFKYKFDNDKEYSDYKEDYQEACSEAKEQLYAGGYKIYTSLNEEKQCALQSAIDSKLSNFDDKNDEGTYKMQGSGTVIDNQTGLVVAVSGGRTQAEFNSYTLNRAYQSFRQPGSSIKPLVVYTPALENKFDETSILHSINVASAVNYNEDVDNLSYYAIQLKYAVQTSNNGAAWWLFCQMDPNKCVDKLTKMNFSEITYKDYNAATSLGGLTNGTTTLEMAGAYTCLANNGTYRNTTCITSIVKPNGKEIKNNISNNKVYTVSACKKMISILKGVVKYGTASAMNWDSDIEVAGKTGTTDDNKDGWFCGCTPYYSAAIWVGYDSPTKLNSLYGASYPMQIWKQTMEECLKDKKAKKFE